MFNTEQVDFDIDNHGTILLLRPLSDDAKMWTEDNISAEHQEFAGAIVVEHRYISDIVAGLVADGMSYAFR